MFIPDNETPSTLSFVLPKRTSMMLIFVKSGADWHHGAPWFDLWFLPFMNMFYVTEIGIMLMYSPRYIPPVVSHLLLH